MGSAEPEDPFDRLTVGLRRVREETDDRSSKLVCYLSALVVVVLWLFAKCKGWDLAAADAMLVGIAALLAAFPRIASLQLSRDALKLETKQKDE